MTQQEEAMRAIENHALEIVKGIQYLRSLDVEVVVPPPVVSEPVTENVGPGRKGRKIPWGKQCKKLHPDFLEGLFWIENQIGLKPEVLIPCMKFESNLNPKARNPQSSASGLIQFMAATAKNLGTTIEHIRSLGPMEQLTYVYKYFLQFGKDLSGWDYTDCYMAILWPAGIGKPMEYRVFTDNPLKSGDSYDVNKGLDKNKDGFVTKAEAAAKIKTLLDEGLLPANVLEL